MGGGDDRISFQKIKLNFILNFPSLKTKILYLTKRKHRKKRMNFEDAFKEILENLESFNEWLLIRSSGRTFALRKDEIELAQERGKTLFAFLDENGFQTWRVIGFEKIKNEIVLDLTRNFERQRERIKLVPRVLSGELSASVELARLEKANQIASIIVSEIKTAKIIRVALNKETGRFAQIIFENPSGRQTAALADVSGAATHENILTSAILWLARLENRKKNPIAEIWILSEEKRAHDLQKLHAVLRENWKLKIKLFEISREGGKLKKGEKNSYGQTLKNLETVSFNNLWHEKPRKNYLSGNAQISRAALEIIRLAPEEIDVILTRNGETLRFLGLPFARVRRISGEEKVWFGAEAKRQILNETNQAEFHELIENLRTYRRFNSPNKRHTLYENAPEAWLEAILRRNVKQLDANLILSPLYNQFRAEKDKIDLLALRKDGRLIVIELKVSPDREMIFQAADYWRKVERQRRAGYLHKAKIFGNLEILDRPTLVYLAAPTFSFHRDFEFLAKTITPDIEIYRFDLNENWRENLKVLKRERLAEKKF